VSTGFSIFLKKICHQYSSQSTVYQIKRRVHFTVSCLSICQKNWIPVCLSVKIIEYLSVSLSKEWNTFLSPIKRTTRLSPCQEKGLPVCLPVTRKNYMSISLSRERTARRSTCQEKKTTRLSPYEEKEHPVCLLAKRKNCPNVSVQERRLTACLPVKRMDWTPVSLSRDCTSCRFSSKYCLSYIKKILQAAVWFFCNPGKYSIILMEVGPVVSVFRHELYRYRRCLPNMYCWTFTTVIYTFYGNIFSLLDRTFFNKTL
jgi:hypothetical protein